MSKEEIAVIKEIFLEQRGIQLVDVSVSKLVSMDGNTHIFLTNKKNCCFKDFEDLINSVSDQKQKKKILIFFTRNLIFNKTISAKLDKICFKWQHLHYPTCNIFKHFLVPSYSLTTFFKGNKKKLPKMKLNDPIAKWMGLKKNDVLSVDFGNYKEFRVIID